MACPVLDLMPLPQEEMMRVWTNFLRLLAYTKALCAHIDALEARIAALEGP